VGLERLPEQDVTADGSGEHPGLLGGVRQLTFDLQHPAFSGQLPEDGAQQRRLDGTDREA